MIRFIKHYAACAVLLNSWGERATPWNVRFVWNEVEEVPGDE